MTTKQTDALTLAAELRAGNWAPNVLQNEDALRDRAADELRSLHTENETLRAGYDAARLEIASLQAQLEAVGAGGVSPLMAAPAQPMGAAPAKVLAGVIELAKDAHAHWDADRDAKVGKILMAMAGWNEGYDWRADALHAAAAAPQPAAQALDAARVFWQQHTQADALSMTMAELHDDVEIVIRAARGAAQAAPVDAAVQRESQYNRGFRHGYNRRDAEVKGALA